MDLLQERKYDAVDGRIINRSTGKAIPNDEPIMIFRAKDKNSIAALEYYRELCTDENHKDVVEGRIEDFQEFQDRHPEAVHEPDSSPHCLK